MNESTVSSTLVQLLLDEKDGAANARTIFKQAFLADAVDGLFHARHDAGLTPEQMAAQLHTTEAAILYMEKDVSLMPLLRYAEIAIAYGMAPILNLVPIEQARQEAIRKLQEENA